MEGKRSPSAAGRKPKITFSLDTPYTDVQWPVLSPNCQIEILDMLCSLLSPIGEHKSRNVAPSKGKRAKKRRRKNDDNSKEHLAAPSHMALPENEALARPEIHNHLTVGFNTTTRYLEGLAKMSNKCTKQNSCPAITIETSARSSFNSANIKPVAAIFVTRSSEPHALYSHLPLLAEAASFAVPLSPPTKLIKLPEGAEDRLKLTLGIPRVGMIGLMDGAPDASSLVEHIRQKVPEMEIPWLREAVKGAYLPVKINAIQNGVPFNA